MQHNSHEDAVTPAFLSDIFNRFFSSTLEKDPKYHSFQKEWENFRDLLNKETFDMDQVFSHIAKLQMNLDQPVKTEGTFTTNYSQDRPFIPNLNAQTSTTAPVLDFSAHTPTNYLHNPQTEAGISYGIKTETLYTSPSPSMSAKTFETSSHNTTPLLPKQPAFNMTVGGLTSTSLGGKFHPSFLADRAKVLKQNMQKHNEGLSERTKALKKNAQGYSGDRSNLRDVVIYAKQPNFKELTKNIETKANAAKAHGQAKVLLYS